MKKLLVFFLLIPCFSFFISSCKSKKKTADSTVTAEVKRDFPAEGFIKATVIFYEVDACKYLLQLEPDPNGPEVMKRLEPTNLKEEFKKDQLAVWVKYAVKKGAMSACQAGPVIDISEIQVRN